MIPITSGKKPSKVHSRPIQLGTEKTMSSTRPKITIKTKVYVTPTIPEARIRTRDCSVKLLSRLAVPYPVRFTRRRGFKAIVVSPETDSVSFAVSTEIFKQSGIHHSSRETKLNETLLQTGSRSSGALDHIGRNLPDLSDYESTTRQDFHRAQVAPVASWIRGLVLDVGANFGRFSALGPTTISFDIEKRWLLRGIDLGNVKQAIVGEAC